MNVAVLHLLYGNHPSDTSWFVRLLKREEVVTLLLSTLVILPLCCLRDMSSLTNLSAVSVIAMVFIVIIIIYLYFDNPGDSVRGAGGTLYENWFEIRPGYLERCV
jgi:Na+/pantothenate symporter